MLFEFRNEIVSITEQGKLLPEFIKIKDKNNYRDIIEYVFFLHDRNSMYKNVLIVDRKKIIHTDRFEHLSDKQYALLEVDATELSEKLNSLQFTPNERLIKGMEDKIGEYLSFWMNVKTKDDNHKLVADTIEKAEALLRIKEKIDKMSNKENSERQIGGGKSKLFE